MKKTLTLSITLLAAFMSFGQSSIPNANFEQWSQTDSRRDSLDNWSSSSAVTINPVKSLYKEASPVQGSFAGNIVTAPFGFVQYSTIGFLVNGSATFSYGGGGGGANVAYESGGGTPISFKPTELRGYFKYETLTQFDQGMGFIILTKYNTTTHQRDTVSYATHDFLVQDTFTTFTIPLPDKMPGVIPDTITTIFSSSNPIFMPDRGAWSNLFLDSITLAPLSPIANFSVDTTAGTITTVFQLQDSSTLDPTTWKWTITPSTYIFEPGSTETSQNPSLKFMMAGDYTVKLLVTNTFGSDSMTKDKYIHVEKPTSIIEHNTQDEIAIYPNPAKDKLYLKPQVIGADIHIYDIYGKSLRFHEKVSSSSIDISDLSAGLYFIRLSKEGSTWSHKLWVQK